MGNEPSKEQVGKRATVPASRGVSEDGDDAEAFKVVAQGVSRNLTAPNDDSSPSSHEDRTHQAVAGFVIGNVIGPLQKTDAPPSTQEGAAADVDEGEGTAETEDEESEEDALDNFDDPGQSLQPPGSEGNPDTHSSSTWGFMSIEDEPQEQFATVQEKRAHPPYLVQINDGTGETKDPKIQAAVDAERPSWRTQISNSTLASLAEEEDFEDHEENEKASNGDDDDSEMAEDDMAAILRTSAKIGAGKSLFQASSQVPGSVGNRTIAGETAERGSSAGKHSTHGNKFIGRGVASRQTIAAMALRSSTEAAVKPAEEQHGEAASISFRSLPPKRTNTIKRGLERMVSAPGNVMPNLTRSQFEDVLDEAHHYLAMSMLVYIYSQLREMSVLGYTEIPFRVIDVNPYRPFVPPSEEEMEKRRSLSFSETENPESGDVTDPPPPPYNAPTPQLIPKTVPTTFNAPNTSASRSPRSSICSTEEDQPIIHRDAESLVSSSAKDPTLFTFNTMSAAKIIRIVLEELENERKDSVKDDEELLGFARQHDISIIKEFRKWVDDSRVDQLDAAATAAIQKLRSKVARARWKRTISVVRMSIRLTKSVSAGKLKEDAKADDSDSNEFAERVRTSLTKRRTQLAKTKSAKNWFKLQKRLVEDHFGLDDGGDDVTMEDGTKLEPNQCQVSEESRKVTGEYVTKDLVDDIVNQSLPSYFKKGSVLSRMIDSGLEVAWFGDRHPNEAIYCICCCRVTKTVTVIFRGSVNAHNWLNNMKFMMSDHLNPLANEVYDGRADRFRLHTGFGLYMLRRRKDDGRRKIDEILTKVDAIGREIASDGRYRFSVTGHSLGGALATICSFYAATDKRFTKIAPVRVFTFAAPRVGDQKFRDAYEHLERSGKLRHARFVASCDIVPLTPFVSLNGFKVGPLYKHVGLQIRLHAADFYGKARIRLALDASYTGRKGFWPAVFRGVINSALFNLTTIKAFKRNHRLTEHQRRIHFARQLRLGLGKSEFFMDHRRRELKSLEHYYRIRANIPPTRDHDVKRGSLKPLECVFVVLFVLVSVSGTMIFGWWLLSLRSGGVQDHTVAGTCLDASTESFSGASLSQPFSPLEKPIMNEESDKTVLGEIDRRPFLDLCVVLLSTRGMNVYGDDGDLVVPSSSVLSRDQSDVPSMETVGSGIEASPFSSDDLLSTSKKADRVDDESAHPQNEAIEEDPLNAPSEKSSAENTLEGAPDIPEVVPKSRSASVGSVGLDGKVLGCDRFCDQRDVLSSNMTLFTATGQQKGLEMFRLTLRMNSVTTFRVLQHWHFDNSIWSGAEDSARGVLAKRVSMRAARREVEMWDTRCFALRNAAVVAHKETITVLRDGGISSDSLRTFQ